MVNTGGWVFIAYHKMGQLPEKVKIKPENRKNFSPGENSFITVVNLK